MAAAKRYSPEQIVAKLAPHERSRTNVPEGSGPTRPACSRADQPQLGQLQAERFDLGEYRKQRRAILHQAREHGVWPFLLRGHRRER
jgi:hypothetical protein